MSDLFTDPNLEEVGSRFKKFPKGNRVLAILVSLAMIAVGIFMCFVPITSLLIIEVLTFVGLFIYGIVLLVRYFSEGMKHGWTLASAIINIVLSVWLIINFANHPELTFEAMTLFLALLFAFMSLTSGIGRLQLVSKLKKKGAESTGLLTFSAIIDIIFAVLLIFCPLFITTIQFVIGIYLIFAGIAMFAEACSKR